MTKPGNWDGGYSAPEYRWTEAVRTREFWLLTAAAASLTAVDQLTRTLLFPIADYRFELEGSYRQLEDPYGIVSSVFLLVGGLMAMRMRLRSALLIFAIVHLLAVIIVLLAPKHVVVIRRVRDPWRWPRRLAGAGHRSGGRLFSEETGSQPSWAPKGC